MSGVPNRKPAGRLSVPILLFQRPSAAKPISQSWSKPPHRAAPSSSLRSELVYAYLGVALPHTQASRLSALDFTSFTISYWFHRITELLGLERTSGHYLVQSPWTLVSPRADYTGTRPGDFGMSLERETPRPPWATSSSALTPSTLSSSSLFLSRKGRRWIPLSASPPGYH